MPTCNVQPPTWSKDIAAQMGPDFSSSLWNAMPKYSPSSAKLKMPYW
jgi:hypothetical protein